MPPGVVLLVVTLYWALSTCVRESRVYQAGIEQAFLALLRDPSRHALLTDEYEDAHRAFTQVKQAVRVRRVHLADTTNRIVLSPRRRRLGALCLR